MQKFSCGAQVYDEACVFGNAEAADYANVYDNALVFGDTRITGFADVHGNVVLGYQAKQKET